MPSSEYRRVSTLWAGDALLSFLIGGLIAMVLVGGWPPDLGEIRTWIAFGTGGVIVIAGLIWNRSKRSKSSGA